MFALVLEKPYCSIREVIVLCWKIAQAFMASYCYLENIFYKEATVEV